MTPSSVKVMFLEHSGPHSEPVTGLLYHFTQCERVTNGDRRKVINAVIGTYVWDGICTFSSLVYLGHKTPTHSIEVKIFLVSSG